MDSEEGMEGVQNEFAPSEEDEEYKAWTINYQVRASTELKKREVKYDRKIAAAILRLKRS